MFAYDFSQNGLDYDILSTEDKTCEVSDCSYNLSTVVIPSTVVNNGTTYTVWKSHATLTLLAKQDCPLWLQYD